MIPLVLVVLCAFAAPQAPARKKAAAPKPAVTAPAQKVEAWPISSLKVKGNSLYTEAQILEVTGLKIGASAGDPEFNAARDRLMKTGAFESVGYEFRSDAAGKGVNGTFEVTEVDAVYPYRFEDLIAGDAELRAFVKQRDPLFASKMPATKECMERTAAALKELVAARGFKDNVVGKLSPEGEGGSLAILFRPATGPPSIGEVKFTGNQVLPVSTLNNTFGLVAVGTRFTEKKVRDLLETSIRPLYDAQGRLRASFPKVEWKKMKDIDGIAVSIQVEEGPEFKFGEIRTAGSSLTARELLKTAGLKPGERANFGEVTAAIDRIQNLLHAQGFMRAETRQERHLHDKEQTVDVDLKIVDGPRYEMGKLTIEGLDVTTEPAIRKLWSMTTGKPYNAGYPQLFLDRVRDDGYLENLGRTSFTQHIDEANKTVDVTLNFKGAPPQPQQKKRRGPEM